MTGTAWLPSSPSPWRRCAPEHCPNHQSLAAISSLFCLKIFRNLSWASTTYLALTMIPHGHIVYVDQALAVKKARTICFGLDQLWSTIPKLLFTLLLGLGCVEGYRCFFNSDNAVQHQHHHGVAVHHRQKCLLNPLPLVFHLLVEKFEDPSG